MIVTSNEEFKHLKKQIKEYFERIAQHINMINKQLFIYNCKKSAKFGILHSELNNALNQLLKYWIISLQSINNSMNI
jgi:Mg2+ and Co2+ transporter CorA